MICCTMIGISIRSPSTSACVWRSDIPVSEESCANAELGRREGDLSFLIRQLPPTPFGVSIRVGDKPSKWFAKYDRTGVNASIVRDTFTKRNHYNPCFWTALWNEDY